MSAAASSHSLGEVLGVRGASIAWGRVLAFALAWMLCDVPVLLAFVSRPGGWLSASYWVAAFVSSLLLAALVVVAFRSIRDDVGATLVAAIAYTLLVPWVRGLAGQGFFFTRGLQLNAALVAAPLFGPLFVLLGLALALRSLRPRWLALWIGSLAGFVASRLVSVFLSMFYLSRSQPSATFVSLRPEGFAASLVTATAFTLIFEVLAGLLG